MSFQLILMVSGDVEQVPRLISTPEEQAVIECTVVQTLANAYELTLSHLPDLVVLLRDHLEEPDETICSWSRQVRELLQESRPTVVLLTDATEAESRIQYLVHGADDVLLASMSTEELRTRLLVHLRRNLDLLSSRVSRLAGYGLCAKILQRHINQGQPWAMLLMSIDGFDAYEEVYGLLAGEQVVKTFSSLLSHFVLAPDFIGHTQYNTFVVMTLPEKAEKIAGLLCRQFETATPNFYSERDRLRGYLTLGIEGQGSQRVPFLALSIGIVSSQTRPYPSYQAAFTAATTMMQLAERSLGNVWVSDRLKLTGDLAQDSVRLKPVILVIEPDAALAFLLKSTLEMQQYQVETVSSLADVDFEQRVQLVLLDPIVAVGLENTTLQAFCEQMRTTQPAVRFIFLSSEHERDKAMAAGADLYLPKPFELLPLLSWIQRLLQ